MTKRDIFSARNALIILGIGLLLLIFSGFYARSYYRQLPRHVPVRRLADVNAISDWMTVRYIARAYAVPEQTLLDALGITSTQARRFSLSAIATMQHQSVDQVIAVIRSTIIAYKQTHPQSLPAVKQIIRQHTQTQLTYGR